MGVGQAQLEYPETTGIQELIFEVIKLYMPETQTTRVSP